MMKRLWQQQQDEKLLAEDDGHRAWLDMLETHGREPTEATLEWEARLAQAEFYETHEEVWDGHGEDDARA